MSDYWYCVKHHAVESADGCPPIDRLGPYATQAEAEKALEKVAERNAEWEAEDARWNDDKLED
ncbi:MAG: hypothetical protein JWO46_1717 [Nocardioidaceae bacterium]|nr:hypothetical protein [Nocardioidaceae bacterium]